jgi:hypothetical protein
LGGRDYKGNTPNRQDESSAVIAPGLRQQESQRHIHAGPPRAFGMLCASELLRDPVYAALIAGRLQQGIHAQLIRLVGGILSFRSVIKVDPVIAGAK